MFNPFEENTPLIETDDGILSYQIHPEVGVVLHALVSHWSPEKYVELMECLDLARKKFAEVGITEIYAPIEDDNHKLQKFASMMGFSPEDYVLTQGSSLEYRVWSIPTE